MRLVMPALFIRLPARMKKGTASSGKLSMPLTMRWITTNGGVVWAQNRYSREEPAIEMATGRPRAISARKTIFSMSGLLRLLHQWRVGAILHGGLHPFQHGVATAHVDARDPQGPHEHRCESGGHHAINV